MGTSLRLRFGHDGTSFTKTTTKPLEQSDKSVQSVKERPLKSSSSNYVPLRIYGSTIIIMCPETPELFKMFIDRTNLTLPLIIMDQPNKVLLDSLTTFIPFRTRWIQLVKKLWFTTIFPSTIYTNLLGDRDDIAPSIKQYLLNEIDLITNQQYVKPIYHRPYLHYYLEIQGFPIDELNVPEPFVSLEDINDQATNLSVPGLNYIPVPILSGSIYKQSFIIWLEKYINVVLTLRYIKWVLLKSWNIPQEITLIKLVLSDDSLYHSFVVVRSTIQLVELLENNAHMNLLTDYANKLYHIRSQTRQHCNLHDIIDYLSTSIQ